MNVTVNVIRAWSNGDTVPVTVPYGSTVGTVASQVGAPAGAVYRSNGQQADANTRVGEGDMITISLGKAAAG